MTLSMGPVHHCPWDPPPAKNPLSLVVEIGVSRADGKVFHLPHCMYQTMADYHGCCRVLLNLQLEPTAVIIGAVFLN